MGVASREQSRDLLYLRFVEYRLRRPRLRHRRRYQRCAYSRSRSKVAGIHVAIIMLVLLTAEQGQAWSLLPRRAYKFLGATSRLSTFASTDSEKRTFM